VPAPRGADSPVAVSRPFVLRQRAVSRAVVPCSALPPDTARPAGRRSRPSRSRAPSATRCPVQLKSTAAHMGAVVVAGPRGRVCLPLRSRVGPGIRTEWWRPAAFPRERLAWCWSCCGCPCKTPTGWWSDARSAVVGVPDSGHAQARTRTGQPVKYAW